MNLPNDVARCHGITAGGTDCQRRAQCERWLNRTTAAKTTPWLPPPQSEPRHPCVFLIPQQ